MFTIVYEICANIITFIPGDRVVAADSVLIAEAKKNIHIQ